MAWTDLFLPLTPLYAGVVRGRAAAYARGWLSVSKLPVPVVSVGNLGFGGTGKTPTVIALVRDLVRRGHQPAVLSRGYGRSGGEPKVVLGPHPVADATEAGDEPVEMARALPGVPVVVDGNRVRGGREGMARGADVLLLDDGFQHMRLARDLDLVLLDAGDPWSGGYLPPRGRLREPISSLRRASAVLVTKLRGPSDPRFEQIRNVVRSIVAEIPVLGSSFVPRCVRTMNGRHATDLLRCARVYAFAGIGRPQGFVDLLEGAGANVVGRRWFPDHHRYSQADLSRVFAEAGAQDAVPVTTAKDDVKLPRGLELWVVEAQVEPISGSWDGLWSLLPEVAG